MTRIRATCRARTSNRGFSGVIRVSQIAVPSIPYWFGESGRRPSVRRSSPRTAAARSTRGRRREDRQEDDRRPGRRPDRDPPPRIARCRIGISRSRERAGGRSPGRRPRAPSERRSLAMTIPAACAGGRRDPPPVNRRSSSAPQAPTSATTRTGEPAERGRRDGPVRWGRCLDRDDAPAHQHEAREDRRGQVGRRRGVRATCSIRDNGGDRDPDPGISAISRPDCNTSEHSRPNRGVVAASPGQGAPRSPWRGTITIGRMRGGWRSAPPASVPVRAGGTSGRGPLKASDRGGGQDPHERRRSEARRQGAFGSIGRRREGTRAAAHRSRPARHEE